MVTNRRLCTSFSAIYALFPGGGMQAAPDNPELQRIVAQQWLARGQFNFALPIFQKIVQLKPDDYSAQRDIAIASYMNFLIVNGAVLMPAYGDEADNIAAAVLADAFPDREIVQVPCRPLIWQNGSLHCITMQLPQGLVAA